MAKDSEIPSSVALKILESIESSENLTQRKLATNLGVALGLTNTYLKRCIRKGWIKVRQVPAKRYRYFLTPEGFAEKSRLTMGYLARSFRFLADARRDLDHIYMVCVARGFNRIVLVGKSELAEIAVLCSTQHEIELVGLIDDGAEAATFMKLPVVSIADQSLEPDAVLLTDIAGAETTYSQLAEIYPSDRIFVPNMLPVSRSVTNGADNR